jgi:hypothetical protein
MMNISYTFLVLFFLFLYDCLNSQNVGVGTNTPAAKLHINGDVMIDSLANAGQVIVMADNNGLLYRFLFNGGSGTVLTGNGTWDSINNILWLLSGNDGTDPALDFLGTTDAEDLVFKTNNSENLRITSLGNVGVGITSPLEKLHVSQSVRVEDYIIALGGIHVGGVSDPGTDNLIVDGQVGVGTTTLTTKLDVYPDTDNSAQIGRAHIGKTGHNNYAGFSHVDVDAAGSYALLQSSVGQTYLNAASGQPINFRINNSTKMYLKSDGNLGIGTTSPTTQLEIRNTGGYSKLKIRGDGSSATTRAEVILDRTSSARGAGIRMQNSNAGTDAEWFAGIPYNNGSSSSGYSIGTNSSQPEYKTNSKLFIKTDGNVGIGTISPGADLEVSGQVKITGGSPGAGKVLTSDASGLATWETSGYGNVPVGCIIAWHKSLSGTPSLPAGWEECNGQTISDASSPYNGQAIPDLNGGTTSSSGDASRGRFLRGHSSSGSFQNEQTNNLYGANAHDDDDGASTISNIPQNGSYSAWLSYWRLDDAVRFRMRGHETRVTNMSVVWIMRVK